MKIFIISIYFFIWSLRLHKSIQTYIVYPFKKSEKEIKSYPEDLLQNDLEVILEIGSPPQNIGFNLRSRVYTFSVTSSEVKLPYPTFNEKNSKSFVKISKNYINFDKKEYKKGLKIFESLNINNKEIKDITLILATELVYNQTGSLGLRLHKTHEFIGNLSFIYQIKNKANLDNYAFTLKYDNDDKGELIIGSYPHLYDENYKNKNLCVSKARNIGNSVEWALDFDAIKYDNKTINLIQTKSLIQIEFGLIKAPNSLKKYFNNKFFLNLCKEEFYSKRHLIIIHCNKNIDITNFKNLSFILKDIDYEFILTYKELFIEKDNEYIFSIVFDDDNTTTKNPFWILGKPFMKKYQLIYDLDRKIIGIYKDNDGNKKNNGDNNKKIFIIYIILLCILILIVIGLILFIIFLVKKPRKNKAFELEDDNFDYIPTK